MSRRRRRTGRRVGLCCFRQVASRRCGLAGIGSSSKEPGIRRMLEATTGAGETETRDFAIVVTLYCLGLRVSELCGLNLEETDLARATTWIRGKGRRERELVPLPTAVVGALRRYLAHRGGAGHGPLFVSRSRRRGRDGSARLHTGSVLRIVHTLGRRVGVRVWCHALRHTAITEAIIRGQQSGVGLDQIRAFSRQRSLQDDARLPRRARADGGPATARRRCRRDARALVREKASYHTQDDWSHQCARGRTRSRPIGRAAWISSSSGCRWSTLLSTQTPIASGTICG